MTLITNYSEIQKGDIITNNITKRSGTIDKVSRLLTFGIGVQMNDGERFFGFHSKIKKGMKEGYITIERIID